jgi:radical SAM superfamily enzyme YgiQ (UPF0313 family)
VWFWDDNLTVKRDYIKNLLQRMTPLRKWWLTQASMDIAEDDELLHLMRKSGCIGVFFGIESFGQASLEEAGKPQNKVEEYRRRIKKLHDHGICVMAGFISGFDGDTPANIKATAKQLNAIGVDVPFLSILTPFRGTPSYTNLRTLGRLREELGWEFYNGYNVSFVPQNMSSSDLLQAHRALWKSAFSLRSSGARLIRGLFTLRWGAFLMSITMNVFYSLKALTGNLPRDFEGTDTYGSIREAAGPIMHKHLEAERLRRSKRIVAFPQFF